MNVEQALGRARALGLGRLDAALLLAHRLCQRREWLLAHSTDELDASVVAAFDDDCRRRADDVPIAYLTGEREFMGLKLRITSDVLVPRPETETLAEWAVERLRALPLARPRVVDLGTGSGALALAIASACPQAEVTATDASLAALAVARANAARLGLAVRFTAGDWWSAVGEARFDLAVSNPPYLAIGDPHLPALRHEPHAALVAGAQGLDALAQLVEAAPRHLTGWLLLEHGWDQADSVRRMMSDVGFRDLETRADLSGLPRCTSGRIAA